MGLFRKIIATVLMMLIVIGGCGVLLCELHDCCHGHHEVEHICCDCDNHATECGMHTESVKHKCHEAISLNIESTISEKGSNGISFSALYTYIIYNLIEPLEDESYDSLLRCEVLIDCYTPSNGLLRAPPALV
ncbi:MAG: hypothetical protein SNG27_01810 [Rikenellaceae bacterium]